MAEKNTGLNKPTLYLILYLIEKLNGVLGRTHLQKLLFLTDLMSTKKFKKQQTDLEYQKYKYGPYSEKVKEYVDYLIEKEFVEEQIFSFSYDDKKTYSRFYKKNSLRDLNEWILKNFGAENKLLIDEVIQSYGNIGLQSLLDIVYDLQIVKNTEKCSPLDIAREISNDEEKEIDEFDLPF